MTSHCGCCNVMNVLPFELRPFSYYRHCQKRAIHGRNPDIAGAEVRSIEK